MRYTKTLIHCFVILITGIVVLSCTKESRVCNYVQEKQQNYIKSGNYIEKESHVYMFTTTYNGCVNKDLLLDAKVRDIALNYAFSVGMAKYHHMRADEFRSERGGNSLAATFSYEGTKENEEAAEQCEKDAEVRKAELLSVLQTANVPAETGIWVLSEQKYKSNTSGSQVSRILYLFKEDGSEVKWSNEIRFDYSVLTQVFQLIGVDCKIQDLAN